MKTIARFMQWFMHGLLTDRQCNALSQSQTHACILNFIMNKKAVSSQKFDLVPSSRSLTLVTCCTSHISQGFTLVITNNCFLFTIEYINFTGDKILFQQHKAVIQICENLAQHYQDQIKITIPYHNSK